jgi:A/G-specific adenine glycosylase
MDKREFQEFMWEKARELYRDMPWRSDTRPYYVLVSELMLQQTQVDRVRPKFEAFIAQFPDERALANASLAEVLQLWNGLGYNRRAKFLHEAAKKITNEYSGIFPPDYEAILSLPGVGPGTAGAISVYAFNRPVVFIETNVRTVYFHHFFQESEDTITDKMLTELVEATLDKEHPREFYWALMDYGTMLKKSGAGRIQRSAHYKKQSPLKGSIREVRGQIVTLLTGDELTVEALKRRLTADERFEPALSGLVTDGLVVQTGDTLHLTK